MVEVLNSSVKKATQTSMNLQSIANQANANSKTYSGRLYTLLVSFTLGSIILCVIGKIFIRTKREDTTKSATAKMLQPEVKKNLTTAEQVKTQHMGQKQAAKLQKEAEKRKAKLQKEAEKREAKLQKEAEKREATLEKEAEKRKARLEENAKKQKETIKQASKTDRILYQEPGVIVKENPGGAISATSTGSKSLQVTQNKGGTRVLVGGVEVFHRPKSDDF